MRQLLERAERAVTIRRRATIDRIAEAMTPLGRIETEPGAVRVSGRGLVKRWLSEPSLRFIADLTK